MKAYIILEKTKLSFSFLRVFDVLIRLFTNSKYNHVSVMFYIYDSPYVFESTFWGGVVLEPFERWKLKKKRECRVIETDSSIDELKKAFEYLGLKYDILSVTIGYLVYKLTDKWIVKNNDKYIYCSEFVANVKNFQEPHKITPSDIDKFYSETYKIFTT